MKTKLILILIVALLVAGFVFRNKFLKYNLNLPVIPYVSTPVAQQTTNLQPALNGDLVSSDAANKRPVAVAMDNQVKARPQSGLVDADLVYEALAEGGITRFLAIYQTKQAKNVGPIRSARTYFADIANELNAIYAHVGGNSDVLQYIKNDQYKNISNADQFFEDPYFHRITSRKAPHNVYTSISKIYNLAAAKKWAHQSNIESWKFKDEPLLASTTSASVIKIFFGIGQFSEPDYSVRWQYNVDKNSYQRFMGGTPHKDLETGKQITAKNIIVQFVNTYNVTSDTLYSIGMDLEGQGAANVFLDGKVLDATWKKQGNGRTKYFDSSGAEISFNRGQTWIEIVPQQTKGTVSWK